MYAVVFMGYLTKWLEVFPISNQETVTIAEQIFPRYRVPQRSLMQQVFYLKLMVELYQLLCIKKLNTTAYQPKTDRLVEQFIQTLIEF